MNLPAETVKASAPGKIIITGEHFVVHGAFAVAAAIDRRVTVTVKSESGEGFSVISDRIVSQATKKDSNFSGVASIVKKAFARFGKPKRKIIVKIESEIPQSSGLGSSAAVSVSVAACLSKFLGSTVKKKMIYDLAMEGERAVHGNPSGIDIEASLNGGIFLFSRKGGARPIPLDRVIRFVITDSGVKRSTLDLINRVSDRRTRFPKTFERLTSSASFVAFQTVEALAEGDLPYLGALMCLSQSSLEWLGVSTSKLETLIEDALEEDVFGAKLTGAGGGGSIIALPKPQMAGRVLSRMEKFGRSYLTSLPQEGLRWERS